MQDCFLIKTASRFLKLNFFHRNLGNIAQRCNVLKLKVLESLEFRNTSLLTKSIKLQVLWQNKDQLKRASSSFEWFNETHLNERPKSLHSMYTVLELGSVNQQDDLWQILNIYTSQMFSFEFWRLNSYVWWKLESSNLKESCP